MNHCYVLENLPEEYLKFYARHQLWNLVGYAISPKDISFELYDGPIALELLKHRISMVPWAAPGQGTIDFHGNCLKASDFGLPMTTGDLVLLQGPNFRLKATFQVGSKEAFAHARYDNLYRIKVEGDRIIFWSIRELPLQQVRAALLRSCKAHPDRVEF